MSSDLRRPAMLCEAASGSGYLDSAAVLVVVVNRPAELRRAAVQGWYRIPLAHAPRRVAAEYLAFYQTGAFPPGDRWLVRWLAPVRGYHLAARRDLIPEEPEHPRAGERYYQVLLGPLEPLACPLPSASLRRVTFIPTTLGRLSEAADVRDLWLKPTRAQRLWAALCQDEA